MKSQTRISSIFILQKQPPPPPPPYQILKISSIITRQQQQQQQQLYPKLSSTDSTLSSTPQTQYIAHPLPNPIKSSSRNIRGQKTYPSRDPRTASFTSTPSSSTSSIYCLTGSEYYWTGSRGSAVVAVVRGGGGGGGEIDYDNKDNENGKSENIWWHWREERWNVACG